MESDQYPTTNTHSILSDDNLLKSSNLKNDESTQKGEYKCTKTGWFRQWLLLAVCILIGLVILGAAIAYARVNLEFRDYLFYPALTNLITACILAVVGLIIVEIKSKTKKTEQDK